MADLVIEWSVALRHRHRSFRGPSEYGFQSGQPTSRFPGMSDAPAKRRRLWRSRRG